MGLKQSRERLGVIKRFYIVSMVDITETRVVEHGLAGGGEGEEGQNQQCLIFQNNLMLR